MAEENPILHRRTEGIARLILNRPNKRNALTPRMIAELRDALSETAADPQVRLVLISGAGADFCAGLDLASLEKIAQAGVMENLADARALGEVFIAIRNHPGPVVAAVRGRAMGGGCGLATACDVVLAAESASLGYPEVNIGFIPAIVSALLHRSLPEKRGFDLLTCGELVSAPQAAEAGMITSVFPDSSFESEVERYVSRLASKSPSAISLTKYCWYHTDGLSFESAIEAGVQLNALARMTDDCRSGIRKFLARKEGGEAKD